MARGKLAIGYVTPTLHHSYFSLSLIKSLEYDLHHDRLLNHRIIPVQSGPNLPRGRNRVIIDFLNTDAEWLLSVDTDMVWKPDAPFRLLATADPVKMPVLGGLCFRYDTGIRPTLYRFGDNGNMLEYTDYPRGLVEVDATGAAFLLIHRNVLVTIGDNWFRMWEDGKEFDGEDIAFCYRVKKAGFPIFVDTRIGIGHMKTSIISELTYKDPVKDLEMQFQGRK